MRYRIATQADISALDELRWAFCTEEEEVSPKIDPQEFLAACTQFLIDTLIVWPSEASVNFYRRSGFKRQNAIMDYDLRPE